jgi:HKD family nuclease
MLVTVIGQGINGINLEKHLKELLNNSSVVRCRFLVAFVTLDGLLKLGTDSQGLLFKFLGLPQKKFELIIGVDTVTTPDALREIQRLLTSAKATCIVKAFSNPSRQLFHPKVYIFDKDDNTSTIFIGSNNLTAGGLFGNIEACLRLDNLNSVEMTGWETLWQSFLHHNDVKDIDKELLDRVILRHGQELARNRLRRKLKPYTTKRKRKQLTIEKPVVETSVLEPLSISPKILVRYIPKAGNRVSQVHFTKKIAEQFFSLPVDKGGLVHLQQVQPNHVPSNIEERQLVYSTVNKNPKIELQGAKILEKNYPAKGRPIVIFERVDPTFYRYMLLMPKENGYKELSRQLDSQPQERSLASWITDLDYLVNVWREYPH